MRPSHVKNICPQHPGYYAFLIFLFISGLNCVYAKESIEIAGDTILIGLPLTAYGISFLEDDKTGTKQLSYSLAAVAVSTFALKAAISKKRPDKSNDNSFPSGHTSITFSAASYLRKRYGWQYGIPAYAAASFTGYSRYAAEKHFVEDILIGALIGIITTEVLTVKCHTCSVSPNISSNFNGLTFSTLF